MIGSGLKKLAREHGMKISHGIAYGSIGGFSATLSEGAGFKRIDFSTNLPDSKQKAELMVLTNQTDVSGIFHIQAYEYENNRIVFIFTDNFRTTDRIRDFLNWYIPLLQTHGATGSQICTQCGCQLISGRWSLADGTAYCLHDGCAEKLKRTIEGENENRKRSDTGSYGKGTIGAFLGAALGSIVWAIVLYWGYMAALVGLLIGFLAQKGYDLLHGKQGKGKVAILILAVIFGVVLGTFAANAIVLSESGTAGEVITRFVTDSTYRCMTISKILTGLLFSGLGVAGMLHITGKETAHAKYMEL